MIIYLNVLQFCSIKSHLSEVNYRKEYLKEYLFRFEWITPRYVVRKPSIPLWCKTLVRLMSSQLPLTIVTRMCLSIRPTMASQHLLIYISGLILRIKLVIGHTNILCIRFSPSYLWSGSFNNLIFEFISNRINIYSILSDWHI